MEREEEKDEDMVSEERRKKFISLFTSFEQAVLVAWARRTCYTSPDFDMVKAIKIRERWPGVIRKAREFLEVD